MGVWVDFYRMGFENSQNRLVDLSVVDFIDEIDRMQDDRKKVIRKVGGKTLSIFEVFHAQMNAPFIRVVPFGIFRDDRPFVVDQNDSKKVSELDKNVVELNNIYYDDRHHLAMITSNRIGPRAKDIEDYLNSYLDPDYAYQLRLTPIIVPSGLDVLETAQMIRFVTISIDLGRGINQFMLEDLHNNQASMGNLANGLKKLFEISKEELNSDYFTFTLSMGHNRKDSISVRNLNLLLNTINLSADCIKEITAKYQDETTQVLDLAKLRNSTKTLSSSFSLKEKQISAQYLLNNGAECIEKNRGKWRSEVLNYMQNIERHDEEYFLLEHPRE